MRILVALLLVVLMSGKSHAAATCTASVNAINFGNVNLASGTNTDVQSTIYIGCSSITPGTTVKMCPSINIGSGGWNGTNRTMSGPSGATLAFQLFQDAAYSQLWGALVTPQLGTIPVVSIPRDSSGNGNVAVPIYGRLPGGQSGAPPGSYSTLFTGIDALFRYQEVTGSVGNCTGFTGTSVTSPTFNVVAQPVSACVFTVSDLNFPTSTLLSTPVNGQTTLTATCASQATYTIALDNGLYGTGPTARVMRSSTSANVTYGLYRDSARSIPWGTVASGQAQSGTGTGAGQVYTIYGQVPAQPTATPGTYTDRIVVTIAY
jgi:spore coat protein U-like protein